MDHPEMIAASGLTFAGSADRITELAAAFRGLDRRRVVLTGGAGTGKTTPAVQLLLELLDHPQPGEPIPVLFSLVGWDPQEQPRLQDWLTARLDRDYPGLRSFGTDTARTLVERGRILPILDGLDEVPATLRPGIITALNAAALPATTGLILTSRRTEYAGAVTGAGDVLTAAAVIAPLALTGTEAASYLHKNLPPDPGTAWSTVLGQLETGIAPGLAAVTASPLGLWLVRTVYINGRLDPTPLVDNTHPGRSAHPTLQAHLLDQLIPAVVRSRPPAPRRRSADPSAPLRPRRQHDPDPTALTARLAVGLAVGLVVGLVVGLAFGLTFGLTDFLASANAAQRSASPVTSYRGDRAGVTVKCVIGGLAVGLTFGATFGLRVGLTSGLVVGLTFGLTFGLAGEAWPAFLVASGWLSARRRLPWRLMAFLEDAYRLGLLRVVGSAYQFRHAELQDHLAPELGHVVSGLDHPHANPALRP